MESDTAVNEKRNIFRLTRHYGLSWQLNIEDDSLITKNITNISPQGMSFKAPTSAGISPGQFIRFTLSLSADECFECEGQVMWMKSAEDRQGSMKQFGVQFLKLPMRMDAAIMKVINDSELHKRRDLLEKGLKPRRAARHIHKHITFRSILPTLLGGLLVVILTAAFLMAVWIHEQSHPEDSIAQKFSKGLKRKLSSSPDDFR